MARTKLRLAVELYRNLDQKKVLGADLTGTLVLDQSRQALLDEIVDRQIQLDVVPRSFTVGDSVEIELPVPRSANSFFANSWQELLDHHSFRFAAPKEFFVAQENYYSDDASTTVSSKRYNSILSLISVLKQTADYVDSTMDGLKLIFLTNGKFELPINYQYVSFRDTPGCAELASNFENASTKHLEQRKAIVKIVLSEMLSGVASSARFKDLLERFPEFIKRVKDNYELYIAEFSFEKILEDIEAHKLDYTIKLNKVFSDIQSQLLAIPAALILVGSQLVNEGALSWKNVLIIVGVFIYSVLMNLLIRNQRNSLLAIGSEIRKQEEYLLKRHVALKGGFDQAFSALNSRFAQQQRLIWIVDFLVALMLGCSVFLFIWYSVGSENWLKAAMLSANI
jgi:hypothetical protein